MVSDGSSADIESKLSAEEIRYMLHGSDSELVLNSLPVGVALLRMPGYILEMANSTFARMIGEVKSHSLAPESRCEEVLPKQWMNVIIPLVDRAIETKNRVTVCKARSGAEEGGSDAYWLIACQPVPNGASNTHHAIILSQDVSEQSVLLKRLKALSALGSSLSRGYSLDEFLGDGIGKCSAAISADYCAAFLLDQDTPRLLRVAESKPLCWLPSEITFDSPEEWPCGIETSASAYVSLPQASACEARWLGSIGAYGYLRIPLMTVGRPIGVMAAVFKKIGYVPPQEDIEFAELVAERCAMAIAADAAIAEYGRLLAAEQEAHRAATAKAAQMEALLESLECGVVVYDRNGYVMLTNRACEEMLDVGKPQSRYGDDIAFGITLEKLDGEAVSLKEMPYCKLLREGTLADQHYIMHYTDGSYRVMSFNGGIVRDAKGQMSSAIIIMRDITRMYEMEKTREEMIRLISHDLRSPLTLILARAQMMERVADKPDTVRKNAMGIVLSARYMNIMISDLSDSFRIQSGKITLKRQVFDLAKFMSDCVERWLDAPETTRLKLDIEPNLPPVYADPVRLERILTNLTTNAFKYSTGDSEVLVEAARYQDSDDQALISITDHGQGIAEDELPHIFERYWRASEARERSEGMGLGLYICKELVEAHGGRIWVRSVQGQGSTFFFTVPFAG